MPLFSHCFYICSGKWPRGVGGGNLGYNSDLVVVIMSEEKQNGSMIGSSHPTHSCCCSCLCNLEHISCIAQHFAFAFLMLWKMNSGRAGPWINAPNVTPCLGEALPNWGKSGWMSPFGLHATEQHPSVRSKHLHRMKNSNLSNRCLNTGLSSKHRQKAAFGWYLHQPFM